MNTSDKFNKLIGESPLEEGSLFPPFEHVDIQNLEDHDPEAAAVFNSAQKTVEKIFEHRKYLDEDGQHDQPLYVVVGEQHSVSAHYLHHMIVIDMIKAKEDRLVCGLEAKESDIHDEIADKFDFDTQTPSYKEHYTHANDSSNISLEWLMGYTLATSSPYATMAFHKSLSDKKIPTRLTDAAEDRDQMKILDAKDPDVLESIVACGLEKEGAISSIKAAGVYVRNHHAAKKLIEHAEQNNARYAINFSGNNHVNGDDSFVHNFPEEQSLVACLKDKNVPVLGFILDDRSIKPNIPPIASDWRTTVLQNILAQTDDIHVQGSLSDKQNYRYDKNFDKIEASQEKEWLDDRLKSLGMDNNILSDLGTVSWLSERKFFSIAADDIVMPTRHGTPRKDALEMS